MGDVKIGIYGGTFAPVHSGHIRSAYAFLSACDLDRLFIIPTNVTPRKVHCPGDDPKTRLHMLNMAFSNLPFYNDRILISDFEIRNPGISYTYKTLEHFKFISNDLTLLCGTDNFLTLEKWKNFERIFELAAICYIRRESDAQNSVDINDKINEYRTKFGAEVYEVECDPIEISSSEIRCTAEKLKSYLPKKVYDYIQEMGLYA